MNALFRAAIVLAVTASPAFAQDMTFSSGATDACFASGGKIDECVGASAQACIAENPDGFTTVGMGFCFEQEWLYWDAALNDAYRLLMEQARASDGMNAPGAPSQAEALRTMQRAWIAFRDGRCGWEYSLWGGGTGGGPANLSCLMAETADQALYLEEQLGGE